MKEDENNQTTIAEISISVDCAVIFIKPILKLYKKTNKTNKMIGLTRIHDQTERTSIAILIVFSNYSGLASQQLLVMPYRSDNVHRIPYT